MFKKTSILNPLVNSLFYTHFFFIFFLIVICCLFLCLVKFKKLFLIMDDNESLNDLLKLFKHHAYKIAAYNCHVWFISSCLQLGITPKGLQPKFPISGLPPSMHNQVKLLSSQTSVNLSYLVLNSYRSLQKEHSDKIYIIYSTIYNNAFVDSNHTNKITEILNKTKIFMDKKINCLLKKLNRLKQNSISGNYSVKKVTKCNSMFPTAREIYLNEGLSNYKKNISTTNVYNTFGLEQSFHQNTPNVEQKISITTLETERCEQTVCGNGLQEITEFESHNIRRVDTQMSKCKQKNEIGCKTLEEQDGILFKYEKQIDRHSNFYHDKKKCDNHRVEDYLSQTPEQIQSEFSYLKRRSHLEVTDYTSEGFKTLADEDDLFDPFQGLPPFPPISTVQNQTSDNLLTTVNDNIDFACIDFQDELEKRGLAKDFLHMEKLLSHEDKSHSKHKKTKCNNTKQTFNKNIFFAKNHFRRNNYKPNNTTPTVEFTKVSANNVENLSSRILEANELSLLSKGLSFSPTPKFNQIELVEDVQSFVRKTRIKYILSQKPLEGTATDEPMTNCLSKFKDQSDWDPDPLPADHPLEQFLNVLISNVSSPDFKLNLKRPQQNLTKEEFVALNCLKNDKNIIILPADKGDKIVIMNIIDYINEAARQLSDDSVYELLNKDPTRKFNKEIQNYLKTNCPNEGFLAKTIKYLTPQEPITPTFYLLPKIHKEIIPPPGRPIVSGCGGPTERISALIDSYLQPIARSINSYIKDTYHFIEKLNQVQQPLKNGVILVTTDVESLYTNISHNSGLESLHYYLEKRPIDTQPSTLFITSLAEMVLTKNAFRFKDDFYLQKKGTAMGTRMAPSYANLFMGKFETEFLNSEQLQPLIWLRYIDDIFFLW